MSEVKKFSQKLYDENDMSAKLIGVNYLENTGLYKLSDKLSEQPEQFKKLDFQITLLKNNRTVNVEVERKKVWTKDFTWQGYNTVDVPHRKKDSKSDLFIMTNFNVNTIAITSMKKVLNSPVSAKKTKYTNNELFFNVSLSDFKFMKKIKGIWSEC